MDLIDLPSAFRDKSIQSSVSNNLRLVKYLSFVVNIINLLGVLYLIISIKLFLTLLSKLVPLTPETVRTRGWSGGAMVLGKLPVPGRPTIWITVGQGPIALAVGAGGGGLDIFTLIYPFSSFSLSLGDGPI